MQEIIDDIAPRDKMTQAVWLGAQEIARTAADYAPKGWSRQLSQNIIAQRPLRRGGSYYAIITSRAVGKNGDYALKQHDQPLRHFKPGLTGSPGMKGSRFDKGFDSNDATGKTREQRYWRGFFKAKNEGQTVVFKTKFLTRAARDESDKIMESVARSLI